MFRSNLFLIAQSCSVTFWSTRPVPALLPCEPLGKIGLRAPLTPSALTSLSAWCMYPVVFKYPCGTVHNADTMWQQ